MKCVASVHAGLLVVYDDDARSSTVTVGFTPVFMPSLKVMLIVTVPASASAKLVGVTLITVGAVVSTFTPVSVGT